MKILICKWETPGSETTIQFGRYIARITGAETTLTPPLPLKSGLAAQTILRLADEGPHDMIVLGPPGVQPLGRVARQVVAQVRASVLVVKGQPRSLERLLVCSGGRAIAEPVIGLGAQLAQAARAKATLLHVASAVPSMYTGLDAMEDRIEDLLKRDTPEAQHLRHAAQVFEEHNVEAVLELRHGVAADEIMRSTQLRDYDLIVIGASDAAPRLNRLFVGQMTQQIVDRAPISVLVARAAAATNPL